jgi:hypothetical protein
MDNKDQFIELAKEAGFIFWDDEEHKPEGATIDWSSNYDSELRNFYELVRGSIK